MDQFSVKTHVFEGPLDMLLSLIEKRKLFINDISLSQVANDFIAYVQTMQEAENSNDKFGEDLAQNSNEPSDRKRIVGDLAQFILVASTLVLIKSKSLLPQLELSEEEKGSIDDLEERLREYQKYKALAEHLRKNFGIHTEYIRQPAKNMKVVFAPDKNTNTAHIAEIMRAVIAAMPKLELTPKAVVQKVISLEEMIENLSTRISLAMKMSFRDFAQKTEVIEEKEIRLNIIVSFLAMLELVKQGIITVRQEADFEDIEMESDTVLVPRY